MDDFIQSLETLDEIVEVFNQLHSLILHSGFDLKKWIINNDAVSEAIPEDMKSVGKTKQVEVQYNTKGSSVLRLQITVTDD